MTREWIIAHFNAHQTKNYGHGDHNLNPGMNPPKSLTQAAVLIPIIIHETDMTILLTQRSNYLAHHPGQVSFPGGHVDTIDASPEDTALRETKEEVGIDRSHVEIIGRLSDYWTRTGFAISPIVGILKPPFDIHPDPSEVAKVFELPISFLLNPKNHKLHRSDYKGTYRQFHAMLYKDFYIWGATAGILMELYSVLKEK